MQREKSKTFPVSSPHQSKRSECEGAWKSVGQICETKEAAKAEAVQDAEDGTHCKSFSCNEELVKQESKICPGAKQKKPHLRKPKKCFFSLAKTLGMIMMHLLLLMMMNYDDDDDEFESDDQSNDEQ